MFANYLIGLREGLEAALVVGILLAYVKKSNRAELASRIWVGVGLAVAASLGFGALLTFGPRGLSSRAEEIITGTLSFVAVGFVTWMIFWMARTARNMKGELEQRIDVAAAAGGASLVLVAVMAVGREGLETALFLWAAARATGDSAQPFVGAAFGLLSAVVLGIAIYKGSLKLNMASFFRWTGGLLVIVAAGVLAYAIHEFQEAGVLPGEDALAFDVSGAINPDGSLATLLKGMFNFSPVMSVLQVVAWLAYVAGVMPAFIRTMSPRPKNKTKVQLSH